MNKLQEKIFKKMKNTTIFAKYGRQLKLKLKLISGFILVTQGQCKLYPNDYVLNLICSNVQGLGSVLLGLYYTILKHPIIPISKSKSKKQKSKKMSRSATIRYDKMKKTFKKYKREKKYGIDIYQKKFITSDELIPTNGMALLETASGYFNYPGICSYQKFGFEYDKSLFSKTQCVYEYDNTPMSIYFGDDATSGCYVNLTIQEKINKILQIMVGNQQCNRDVLCRMENNDRKKLLTILKQMLMYSEGLNQNSERPKKHIIIEEFTGNVNYKSKLNEVLDSVNLIKEEHETNYMFIQKVVNDLENNRDTDDIFILLPNMSGGKKKKNKTRKLRSRHNGKRLHH